jgi:VanZ family protein
MKSQPLPPNSQSTFVRYWLPLIAYCAAIFIQSSFPAPEQLPSFRFSDKLLHAAAYALMGVLFYRAYATIPLAAVADRLILLSILSAALYGASDEIHQAFVPFRNADVLDAVADAAGAVIGVLGWHSLSARLLRHRRLKRRHAD